MSSDDPGTQAEAAVGLAEYAAHALPLDQITEAQHDLSLPRGKKRPADPYLHDQEEEPDDFHNADDPTPSSSSFPA